MRNERAHAVGTFMMVLVPKSEDTPKVRYGHSQDSRWPHPIGTEQNDRSYCLVLGTVVVMASTDTTKNRDKVIREDLRFVERIQRAIYENGHMILAAMVAILIFFPQLFEVLGLAFVLAYRLYAKAPFPEGRSSFGKEQKPGTPLYCMGLDMSMKQPVWFSDSEMRTHMLVMGTTGAGKTEFLLYLSAQAMAQGSGVIFVDGKGDIKTWFRLFSIARRFGMEENLRVLNFGTNRKMGDIKYDLSNTINPFTLGDAGQLAEMMSALMAEAGGDGGMWKGRAESMMRALSGWASACSARAVA